LGFIYGCLYQIKTALILPGGSCSYLPEALYKQVLLTIFALQKKEKTVLLNFIYIPFKWGIPLISKTYRISRQTPLVYNIFPKISSMFMFLNFETFLLKKKIDGKLGMKTTIID